METNRPKFVIVMSGKGGVGKSTVAANIARLLSQKIESVGLLDLDLTGPSIPTIFGVQNEKIKSVNNKMIPCKSSNIEIVSLGLLLANPNDAVIWRGPRKSSMIQTFFNLIEWNSKVIIVDMPPGTSDEHLSTIDMLKQSGVVFSTIIVTTPNVLSVADVRKEINLCQTLGVTIDGIVENFCGVVCPCCGELTDLQENDAAVQMSNELGIPILSKIPFLPQAAADFDGGKASVIILPYFEPVVLKIISN
ncbi:ATP-binding protein [Histomonas meleagridis]|uniref:ATP-binding protein n=1 Tax=Histomonas meleagridis TaxID=135588 RepID=UPI00355A5F36|nr:ATP-binding protein [Histomonas meleagridis]KAH0804678.1 ATP-binding protein [Histomonas meleagridis]